MQWVGRRLFKTELVVEPGGVVMTVGNDCRHTDMLGDHGAADQCVLQHAAAESFPLVALIDGKARENDDRDRPTGGLASQQTRGSVVRADLADGQRVEPMTWPE